MTSRRLLSRHRALDFRYARIERVVGKRTSCASTSFKIALWRSERAKSAPACIGEDQYTCVATLAQQFAITDSYSGNNSVVDETTYDVNGKPVNAGKFEFVGYVPKPKPDNGGVRLAVPTKFAMSVGRDGSVSLLTAHLPKRSDLCPYPGRV